MLNSPRYCTYITIYLGDKLPSFYIGSSSVKRIKNGYHGSVSSKDYESIWKSELKNNPHLFRTVILEIFYSRKNALFNEMLLHKQFNVAKSDQFINMSIARGRFSRNQSGENNPQWGKSPSEETRRKLSIARKNRIEPIVSVETRKKRSIIMKGRKFGPRSEETKRKQSITKIGKKRGPFSEEWKNNLSLSIMGENNPNATPVEINGIIYGCKKDAMSDLNLSLYELNKLIKVSDVK